MNKRTIAIVLEALPVISALLFFILLWSSVDTDLVRALIKISMLIAFFGFVFFFVGRRLAKGDTAVRILGILDILATLSIIGFYGLAIFAFGL